MILINDKLSLIISEVSSYSSNGVVSDVKETKILNPATEDPVARRAIRNGSIDNHSSTDHQGSTDSKSGLQAVQINPMKDSCFIKPVRIQN